ncbi:MAG: cupin domain-containing protein [Owenweeksia sp.]
MMQPINFTEKFEQIHSYWTPFIVGELNNQWVKLAKLKGEFIWHSHADEDELFMVVKGELSIEFRDRMVHLEEGEMCIVPKQTEHKPVAREECHIMLFEPKSTAHTGEVEHELTVKNQQWL